MGCNAWNHSSNCTCGWGGDGHAGRNSGGYIGINKEGSCSPQSYSQCQISTCPKCGEDIFFIRHNGGAVWLDPPLCPPWFKHSCFDQRSLSNKQQPKLLISFPSSENHKIGVVSKASHKGDIQFITNNNHTITISVSGNPNELEGELCFYDDLLNTIWASKRPKRVYSCISSSLKRKKTKHTPKLQIKNENSNPPLENKGKEKITYRVICHICGISFKNSIT